MIKYLKDEKAAASKATDDDQTNDEEAKVAKKHFSDVLNKDLVKKMDSLREQKEMNKDLE